MTWGEARPGSQLGRGRKKWKKVGRGYSYSYMLSTLYMRLSKGTADILSIKDTLLKPHQGTGVETDTLGTYSASTLTLRAQLSSIPAELEAEGKVEACENAGLSTTQIYPICYTSEALGFTVRNLSLWPFPSSRLGLTALSRIMTRIFTVDDQSDDLSD